MNKKLLIIIAAVVVVLAAAAVVVFLLVLGGGEEAEEPPEPEIVEPSPIPAPIQYEVESNTVMALPVGSTVTVFDVTPTPAPEGEEETTDGETTDGETTDGETEDGETEATDGTTVAAYHYEGLAAMVERVAEYAALLTKEDFGFTPVDENRMETTLPDFQATEGSVHLVRPITVVPEEGEETESQPVSDGLFSLRMDWGAEQCTVSVGRLEGGIVVPQPETPAQQQTMSMTLLEAVDYVRSLSPENLGLSGESMEDYHVYALSGVVMVNGAPCLQLNVYGDSVSETNEIAGQYFLSGDGLHVYLLQENGSVKEVNI